MFNNWCSIFSNKSQLVNHIRYPNIFTVCFDTRS